MNLGSFVQFKKDKASEVRVALVVALHAEKNPKFRDEDDGAKAAAGYRPPGAELFVFGNDGGYREAHVNDDDERVAQLAAGGPGADVSDAVAELAHQTADAINLVSNRVTAVEKNSAPETVASIVVSATKSIADRVSGQGDLIKAVDDRVRKLEKPT